MKYNKQVSFGYDPITGKRIRKWFHADTKAKLDQMILEYKMELEKVANPSEITFGEYSARWFDVSKRIRSKQTQDVAMTHLKKCAALNPYKVKKITKTLCQEIVNESWNHPHTAKGICDVLRQVFNSAIEDGIITQNPADKLKRPAIPKAEKHLLTDREIEAVKNADINDQDRLLVTILQLFGLRPAEALALRPDDFDFKKKILTVSKSLELTNDNQSRIKETKTGVTRKIPIPDAAIPSLRKRIQARPGFFLFTKHDGNLYTKSAYKRAQERIWKAVNVQLGGDDNLSLVSGLTLYSFRHHRATELYYQTQKGLISTKKAAELMGHSEVIFLQTYSHIDETKENVDALYPNLEAVNL